MPTPNATTSTTYVLLHGFLASSAYWRRLKPLLTQAGDKVVAIDLLGFGAAPKPRGSAYDYAAHLAHISESLRAHKLSGKFVLVGHSMGAALALRYARTYPADVIRLVLLEPPLFASAEQAQQTILSTGRAYRFLFTSRYRGVAWGALRLIPNQLRLRHTKYSRERSLQQIVLMAECIDDLASISGTPTTVLLGQHDRPEYIANAQALPAASHRRIYIEPVAHHAALSNPQLTYSIIQR